MTQETRKKITKWFWILVTFPVLFLLFLILLVWMFADIPSFKELENPDSKLATQVIAEGGEVLTTFHIENRTFVTYEELSPNIVHAAVATEDIRFYRHSGIDFIGLGRVLFKTILMQNSRQGGGSTITQQLAKTLYPRKEIGRKVPGIYHMKMVWTKLKEWITAVKLERDYTKDEIMTMYLNSIFFGSSAYGVRSASETFFGKSPSELTVEESAMLVGMVNKPTRYNPAINPDKALSRRNFVISQMEKAGYSVWDVNHILDYKKFRQIGLSSKETVDMVRNCDLASLLWQLEQKKADASYLAQYYQAKALKLDHYHSVISNAGMLIGKYYIMNRPENYSLFTRTRTREELHMISADETNGGFQELTRHYPFIEHIYRIKKEKLASAPGQEQAEWGFTVKKYWVNRLSIQFLPKMEHIRTATCLFTVIRLAEREYFTNLTLTPALEYITEHKYQVNGDILGIYFATLKEEGRNMRYMELWIPICMAETTTAPPESAEISQLKKLFV